MRDFRTDDDTQYVRETQAKLPASLCRSNQLRSKVGQAFSLPDFLSNLYLWSSPATDYAAQFSKETAHKPEAL
jgi:hypothetical protein